MVYIIYRFVTVGVFQSGFITDILIQHFLWRYRFSDPYAAYCYDVLHSDDLGKWGKHLWPLTLDVLDSISGAKSALSKK